MTSRGDGPSASSTGIRAPIASMRSARVNAAFLRPCDTARRTTSA